MKKLFLITILVLALSASIAFAEDTAGSAVCNYLKNDLGLKEGFEIPSQVPYSNEVFNLYTKDNEVIGHVTITEKKVTTFSCESNDKPTFNIYIKDKSTISDITSAEKPLDELNAKLSNKDIELKGASVGKKMKGFFTRMGLKIAGWFS